MILEPLASPEVVGLKRSLQASRFARGGRLKNFPSKERGWKIKVDYWPLSVKHIPYLPFISKIEKKTEISPTVIKCQNFWVPQTTCISKLHLIMSLYQWKRFLITFLSVKKEKKQRYHPLWLIARTFEEPKRSAIKNHLILLVFISKKDSLSPFYQ